jgi:hypothetical protein
MVSDVERIGRDHISIYIYYFFIPEVTFSGLHSFHTYDSNWNFRARKKAFCVVGYIDA